MTDYTKEQIDAAGVKAAEHLLMSLLSPNKQDSLEMEVAQNKQSGEFGVLFRRQGSEKVYAFPERYKTENEAVVFFEEQLEKYKNDTEYAITLWTRVFLDEEVAPVKQKVKYPSGTVQLGKGYITSEDKIQRVAKAIYSKRHGISLQKTDEDFEAYYAGKLAGHLKRVRTAVEEARTAILAFLDENPQRMHNDGRAEEYPAEV